ncbi:MAG: CCA tRNA nucleotidyltransferase [Bacillota bacterium]
MLKGIPQEILEICRILSDRGYQAYLIGGAVRDLLRGCKPLDWDIVTDCLPDQAQSIFPDAFPSGIRYGTVSVKLGAMTAEVTTMRKDGRYTDGRRPDQVIYSGDIHADLSRRDFTINAMAYHPGRDELVDPFGGRIDLRRRILRTVGDPRSRFAEDALRMLRLFRFISVLGFKSCRKTLAAVNPLWLKNVSRERVREELSRLLTGENVKRGLSDLAGSGLLTEIIPEFTALAEPGKRLIQSGLWKHHLICADSVQPVLHLRLAAFLHDLGKPYCRFEDEKGLHFYGHDSLGSKIAEGILKRLRYSGAITEKVTRLVRHHMFAAGPGLSDGALRRLADRTGEDLLFDLLELRRADIIAGGRREWAAYRMWEELVERVESLVSGERAFTRSDLALDGNDIMRILKIPPGPRVGEIIDALWERVTDNPDLNTRESLQTVLEREFIP